MNEKQGDVDPDTRTRIILAAGELFAARGLDGTGVREIIARAGVALSAVYYHFGSKVELYVACLRHVLEERIHVTRLFDALIQDPGDRTPQQEVAALLDGTRAFVRATLALGQADWFGKMVTRALLELPIEQHTPLREAVAPVDDALRRLAARFRPHLSRTEVQIMINGLYGKVHMSLLARELILEDLEQDDYDESYLEALAIDLARGVTSTLGLPDPATVGGRNARTERNGVHS